MTHRSLFKEVAQRIVQRAQSSESDAHSPLQARTGPLTGQRLDPQDPLMGRGLGAAGFTSPTDTSPAPRR